MGAADQTLGYRITGDASGLDAAIASSRKGVSDLASESVGANKAISDSAIEALRQQANLSAAQYKTAEAAKGVVVAVGDQTAALAALVGKIDPTVAKLGALDSQLEQLKKFKSSGAINGEDFAAYAAKIELTREAINDASAAETVLTLNTSNTRRGFGLLIKDLLSGNFGQAQREIGTLAGATGIMQLAFSAAGAAIIGTIAVIGAAIALFVSAENQLDGFNRQLLLSGNYAGQTAQGLGQLTTEIGAATGHYGEASEALTKLAGNGRIAGQELKDAAQGAVDFATLTGESIDKAVGEFEKIAKDPVAAISELNEKYNFLTAAQAAEIIQLADEGQKTAAATLETKLFAQALADRKDAYKAGQGEIKKAWDDVTAAIGSALDKSNKFFQRAGTSGLSLTDFTPAGALGLAFKIGNAISAPANGAGGEVAQGSANLANANAAATGQAAQADAALTDAVVKLKPRLDEETKSLEEQTAALGKGKAASLIYQEQQQLTQLSVGKSADEIANIKSTLDSVYGPAIKAAQGFDAQSAAQKAAAAAARQMAQDENTLYQVISDANAEVEKAFGVAQQLADGMDGPFAAANKKFNDTILTLADGYDGLDTKLNLGLIGQAEYADGYKKIDDAVDRAVESQKNETAAIQARLDVGTTLLQHLRDENEALLEGTNESRAWQLVEKASEDALSHSTDLYGKRYDSIELARKAINDEKAGLASHVQALLDDNDALKQNEAINKQWVSIASNGLDSIGASIAGFVTGSIKGWHAFGQALVQDTANFVGEIIQQLLKLTVFNGIINNLFGLTGSSALPTGLGNGLIGQLLGGASGGSTVGGGSGFNLFSADSWISAGKSLYSGFETGAGNLWSQATGAYTYTPTGVYGPSSDLAGDFMGPPSQLAGAGSTIGQYGGYSSPLTQGLGIAGGVYAGYNEFNNAGGGAAGIAGGLAYGTGTYLIGAGITAAMSGGLTAGVAALGALGPIGWAAIAATLIDKFSGGKLFGTSYQTIGATQSINVGPDGASADVSLQQSKQSALFGGKKYRDKSAAASPELTDAANQEQDSLTQLVAGVAKSIAIAAPDLIAETLSTVQTFDKHGKVTGTTYQTNVDGQVFTDATAELQQTRAAAEQIINTVSHSDIGKDAETIAQQWRSSADTLMDGAQLLVAATTDIVNSQGLLGKDSTLADVVSETEKLAASGETLSQAYVRLQTETIDVQSTLDQLGITTSKTGASFVEFSDDMVKAAGSLDNLNTLWSDYFNNYYSDNERAAAKLQADQANESKLFAAIGQDPNESMADFRKAFTSVFDTLSPDDVVKWLQAGEALAIVNQDLGTTASQAEATAQAQAQAAAAYNAFIQPFRDMVNGVTDFESAVRSMGDSVSGAIAQANALAQAQGLQGASAEDVATIIKTFAIQGANALLQLQQQTQQLASKLYGADYLQSLLDDYKQTGNIFDIQKITDAQGAQVKQQDNSRYLDAFQLANNAAQISAFTGENIDDVLKELGVPLGALGNDLKLKGQSTEDYLSKLVDQAKINEGILDASDITNKLLQDILDQARGAPLTYTKPSDFGFADPVTGQQAVSSGKPVGRGVSGPVTVTPQPIGTAPSTPPASSGGGGDGDDVGKAVGRVGDAVDGAAKAITASGEDVKTTLLPILTAINALTAAINRSRLVQPTPSIALSRN